MVSIHPIETFFRRYRAHKYRNPPPGVILELLAQSRNLPSKIAADLRSHGLFLSLLAAARFYAHAADADSVHLERAWLALAAGGHNIARTMLCAVLLEESRVIPTSERALMRRIRKLLPRIDGGGWHEYDLVATGLQRYSDGALSSDGVEPWPETVPKGVAAPTAASKHSIVVCTGFEPTHSADASFNVSLKPYKILREPIELRVAHNFEALAGKFPWFKQAIEAILRDQREGRWFRLKPILLLGPPGIGKSAFARQLAALAGLPFMALSFAGQTDSRGFLGTARGWGNATTALVTTLMMRNKCANPLIFVDEIEKAERTHNGDPRAALLIMAERETARVWEDPCLQTTVDVSHVCWVAGANTLDGLDPALLSRFRIVRIPRPGADDWTAVRREMLLMISEDIDLPVDALPPLDPEVDDRLRNLLVRRGDLRLVRRALEAAIKIGLDARVVN